MLTDQQKAAVAKVPERYRRIYTKALNGSLRAAITAKCLECCAWVRKEGGKDNIKDCHITTCPLWPKRPYQLRSSIKNTENPNPVLLQRLQAARKAKKAKKAKKAQNSTLSADIERLMK